jgi:hypothetical protein
MNQYFVLKFWQVIELPMWVLMRTQYNKECDMATIISVKIDVTKLAKGHLPRKSGAGIHKNKNTKRANQKMRAILTY